MNTIKIAIIGGGNLGTAIAQGLLKSNFIQAKQLTITKRNINSLEALSHQGVNIMTDNAKAIEQSDIIIFAVKPYNCIDIIKQNIHVITPKHIIVSVVTGIWIKDIEAAIGNDKQICRAMPNTAIAIQESLTALSFNKNIDTTHQNLLFDLFNQLGKSVIIAEELMDAATVLGACGIAFALRFIRAKTQGGIEIGFDSKTASLIATQTIKGAAELLLKTGHHPEFEIDKVTTPKGCTIVGLNEMEHQGFSSALIKGIGTSYKKILQ